MKCLLGRWSCRNIFKNHFGQIEYLKVLDKLFIEKVLDEVFIEEINKSLKIPCQAEFVKAVPGAHLMNCDDYDNSD